MEETKKTKRTEKQHKFNDPFDVRDSAYFNNKKEERKKERIK